MNMVCESCRREVDTLIELILIEGGTRVQVVRCEDCIEVARAMTRVLANSRNN